MKKTFLSLVAVAGLILFSGCGGSHTEGLSPSGGKYHLWERSNGDFTINPLGDGPTLKEELRIAAETAKSKGFSKFVILNTSVSNLSGFPINKYSELKRYVSLEKRKPSFQTDGKNMHRGERPLRTGNGRYQLWFKPVNNEYDGTYISTWDVEQTLRDTK